MRTLAIVLMLLALPAVAATKVKVAVLSLKALNAPESTATAVTEAFVSALSEDGRVEVLSQADIVSMLAFEKQKALLGCDDSSCLTELGGALGASLLVTGALARIDDAYLLNVQLIDVAKGSVVRRASEKIEGRGKLYDAAQVVARGLHVSGEDDEIRHFAIRVGAGGTLGILGVGAAYRVGPIAVGVGTGRALVSGGVTWTPLPASSPYLEVHVAYAHAGLFGEVLHPGVGAGVSGGYDWHPVPWLSVKGGLGLAWNSGTWSATNPRPLFFDLAVGPLF